MSSVEKSASAPAVAYSQAAVVEVVGSAEATHSAGDPSHSAVQEKMSIPENFMRLGCFACSCANMNWPGCFGCKSSGTFLCFEGYMNQCKIMENNPDVCCMCMGGDMECVQPRTCCQVYQQQFCWECFISLPPAEAGFKNAPVSVIDVAGSALMDNVIIVDGMCCVIRSLNCGMPGCLLDGCYAKEELCCIKTEFVRYKFMCWDQTKPNPDTLCILAKGQSLLQYPTTCCKGISHQPCLDSRYACPCDDDVPCVYTMLPCCVACVNGTCQCGCCVTLEQAKYQAKYRGMPPPPGVQTAQPGAPAQRV